MPITIRSRSGNPLYTSATADSVRAAVEQAVASGVDLSYTDLHGVDLHGADLHGADLSYTDLNSAGLSGACLRGACLHGADLHGADLSYTDLNSAGLSGACLHGVDLRGACLRDVDLRGADLDGAILSGAILSGAYLGGAKLNATIPTIPGIHQAVLAAIQSPGHELNMRAWHTCETTHCRAGWVIHLAGAAGVTLEERCGPALAAALIYQASDPTMERVPDFICGHDEAMADIIACAEREVAATPNT